MTEPDPMLKPAPSQISEDQFMNRFGGVYEHSPWVAAGVWQRGLDKTTDSPDALADRMASEVEAADEQRQMSLIRAHPDLGGRAAIAGELTAESAREQAGAGLDACTPEQFRRLQALNDAYVEKFGFPFIVAVKGMQRDDILSSMAERVENDADTERRRALDEIHRIARFRLHAMT